MQFVRDANMKSNFFNLLSFFIYYSDIAKPIAGKVQNRTDLDSNIYCIEITEGELKIWSDNRLNIS